MNEGRETLNSTVSVIGGKGGNCALSRNAIQKCNTFSSADPECYRDRRQIMESISRNEAASQPSEISGFKED
jgi:hypothetical protein